jgi:hypothetical protein
LIQPTSRKVGTEGHAGGFIRNIDGEVRASLDIVILSVNPSRLLWSGDLNDKRPECFSRDAVAGSVYGACNACAFNPSVNSQLMAAIKGGSNPKSCSFGYTWLVIDDVEAATPALVGAMGTSVRPAKILVSQFVQRQRPPFTALVSLESERQTNDRGKFYVLKPTITRWFGDDEIAPWRALYQTLKGVTIRDIDEEEEAVDVTAPF